MKKLFYILAIVASGFNMLADDHLARRYAALDRDRVSSEYFLLAVPSVQANLKLDHGQIERFKSAIASPPTNIPAVAELHRRQNQQLQKVSSDKERSDILRKGNSQISQLINQNLEAQISSLLTFSQSNRLEELFLQMRGISVILENTILIKKLNISDEQMHAITGITNDHHEILSLLRQRFIRLQVQPTRNREDGDWRSEIICLVRVIKEIEKDEDSEILDILNQKQLQTWNELCGEPLSIDWKVDYFSDVPFGTERGGD
jgi:hypothetical protein